MQSAEEFANKVWHELFTSAIGKHELARMISERDEEIRKAEMERWGGYDGLPWEAD